MTGLILMYKELDCDKKGMVKGFALAIVVYIAFNVIAYFL